MRYGAWPLVILLLAPGVVALGGPVLAPRTVQPEDPVPPQCVAENETYACTFFVNTTSDASKREHRFDIPTFRRTLATIAVSLDGVDNGWRVEILREFQGETPFRYAASSSSHAASPDKGYAVRESTTHVFESFDDATVPNGKFVTSLRFLTYDPNGGGRPASFGESPLDAASAGSFRIHYLAEPVPDGVPPDRPAATREVPQLPGTARDADRPEVDLIAAWLDDEALGDGLFDATMAVAGSLDRLDWNRSQPASPLGNRATGFQTSGIEWELHFKVGGTQFYVQWQADRSVTRRAFLECGLYRVPASAPSGAASSAARDVLVGVPECWATNDTMHARIPERSVDNPGPGVVFEELSANVDEVMYSNQYRAQRDSLTATFPFALGGPAIWDELNGCAFCEPAPAWYTAAYLSAHPGDALQIGGALVAIVTFLVGLLLVRRRRNQTKRLLEEVALAEVRHEGDTRGALLALGQLDTRFARLFHDHKITDAQYQVVSQRVATAATRFALRQGLGLDDGVAGDAARARRVPVVAMDPASKPGREVEPS